MNKLWLILLCLIVVKSAHAQKESLFLEEFQQLSVQGMILIEKKCQENPNYCYVLGRFFEHKKDQEKADGFYNKACVEGVAKGCLFWGYSLERQGKEEDSSEKYFFACHKYQDAESCMALGQNYREENNWNKAFNYFKEACQIEAPKGCYDASEMALFKGDRTGQRTWYLRKGCEKDHGLSCWSLAQTQESRGYRQEALDAYKKACLEDFPEACIKFKEINKGGFFKEYEDKYLRFKSETIEIIQKWIEYFFPLDKP